MLTRSQLRHHSAIRLMGGDLRRHHVRNNFLARTHHGRSGLVARAFNSENVSVRHAVPSLNAKNSFVNLRALRGYCLPPRSSQNHNHEAHEATPRKIKATRGCPNRPRPVILTRILHRGRNFPMPDPNTPEPAFPTESEESFGELFSQYEKTHSRKSNRRRRQTNRRHRNRRLQRLGVPRHRIQVRRHPAARGLPKHWRNREARRQAARLGQRPRSRGLLRAFPLENRAPHRLAGAGTRLRRTNPPSSAP